MIYIKTRDAKYMPRTIFSLPDGTLAYIRPENLLLRKKVKEGVCSTDPEKCGRFEQISGWDDARIKSLSLKGHFETQEERVERKGKKIGATPTYTPWVSELSAAEDGELRTLMERTIPEKYKKEVKGNSKTIPMYVPGQDVASSATYPLFIEKFNNASIDTLQLWGQNGGFFYSVVTPQLDEVRCVDPEINADMRGKEPGKSFEKQMKQPFRYDLHGGGLTMLKAKKGEIVTNIPAVISKTDNLYIMQIRTIIHKAYESQKVLDKEGNPVIGMTHEENPRTYTKRKMYGKNFSSQNTMIPIINTDLRSFLNNAGVPIVNNSVKLIHLEQFLQKYGLVVDRYDHIDKHGNIYTEEVGRKCRDLANTSGTRMKKTMTKYSGEKSQEDVIKDLDYFEEEIKLLKEASDKPKMKKLRTEFINRKRKFEEGSKEVYEDEDYESWKPKIDLIQKVLDRNIIIEEADRMLTVEMVREAILQRRVTIGQWLGSGQTIIELLGQG